MALVKIQGVDPERKHGSIERGLRWFLGMQGSDGGWASFDTDNNRMLFNNIPFADHGALLDPSTEDLTGRGLELLGTVGERGDHAAAKRALAFTRRSQSAEGPWYGRWGANYIYGTWSVLRGLAAIGEDASQDYVQRAVAWLELRQNGTAAEGDARLVRRPLPRRQGDSIPSQTSWALLGLFAAARTDRRSSARRALPRRHPERRRRWRTRSGTAPGSRASSI
jgi:squalene-hopene/tetraprenyl-beta-curcumene cyclase